MIMKKLLFILPVLFFSFAAKAQQTEDEVYIGKKYGNFKGTGIIIPETDRKVNPVTGPTTISGVVIEVGWCEEDCLTILLKKADGTTITIGTKDSGFKIPKKMVGQKIIVEGIDPEKRSYTIRNPRVNYQKNIQFAASGVKVVN
jgi:hypothetical protein